MNTNRRRLRRLTDAALVAVLFPIFYVAAVLVDMEDRKRRGGAR